jgi:hypothetical protein
MTAITRSYSYSNRLGWCPSMPTVPIRANTPWGPTQHADLLTADGGIIVYETSSHGGIGLSSKYDAKLPATVPAFAGRPWFEEDCDWAIPYWWFRDEIAKHHDNQEEHAACVKAAGFTIRMWHPWVWLLFNQSACIVNDVGNLIRERSMVDNKVRADAASAQLAIALKLGIDQARAESIVKEAMEYADRFYPVAEDTRPKIAS